MVTYEVEQKFHVDANGALDDAFARIAARFGEPVVQSDTYLAHPARDFSRTDEALRLRRQGEATHITYKGPKVDTTTKTRQEVELPLPEGDDYAARFEGLLVLLGFRVVAQVRKHRRIAFVEWDGATVEISLDDVDGLGHFVELETQADEAGLAAARRALASLATELGLTRDERRSYLELLLAGR
jgi:adenylate cyclase class 2